MKKLYIVIIIMILIPKISYANNTIETDNILEEQEENFGIKDFLKETKQYIPDFIKEIDINDLFQDATTGKIDNINFLKKILKLLTSQITDTLKILVNILVIVLIHSILKSITDNLESNNVSKIVYYVQYILIVTIIMANFSDILNSVQETTDNLVGFAGVLVPLLITLMIYTGSIVTSTVIEPILLFLIEFIANLIRVAIIPIVSVITVLIIVSKITDRIQLDKLSSFFKSTIVWVLGVILTLFVGVLSIEGNLTSSVDGVTAKTTKAVVTNLIPVVGKVLGDSVDSVLGCGVILKNAVGLVGVVIIIGICIMPIIKLSTFSIMYSITSSILEPFADKKITKLLGEVSGIFKILLAILCSISVLLIIGITLVIKISNSGMMYR